MTAITFGQSVAQVVKSRGYAFIHGHAPEASSLDAFSALGEIETVEGLSALQSLVPQSVVDAPPNTYSGNFGTGEFPLHTDLAHWALPPRLLALRCIDGSETVATRLLDGEVIIRRFGADLLSTILVQPRRPMRNGKQILQLLQKVESGLFRLRWDSIYLRPATDYSKRLLAEVSGFVSEVEPAEHRLLNRGDTLILDNWRCLHGRAPAPDDAKQRKIERAYLGKIHECTK